MANITEFAEVLAREGRLLQSYETLAKSVKSKNGKQQLKELASFTGQKMAILKQIITENDWNL